jgi:hypothetical protein
VRQQKMLPVTTSSSGISYAAISLKLAFVFLFLATTSNSFIIPLTQSNQYCSSLHLSATKKGFGNTNTTPPTKSQQKKKRNDNVNQSPSSITTPANTILQEEEDVTATAADYKLTTTPKTTTTTTTTTTTNTVSQGKIALQRMRREKAEQRQEELQKIRQVQTIDQMVRESPEAAVIPEKVAQRMGKRMLPFVGIPLLGSMTSMVGFWYMATYRDMEFQPVLVATTSLVLLAIGIVVSISRCLWLLLLLCPDETTIGTVPCVKQNPSHNYWSFLMFVLGGILFQNHCVDDRVLRTPS